MRLVRDVICLDPWLELPRKSTLLYASLFARCRRSSARRARGLREVAVPTLEPSNSILCHMLMITALAVVMGEECSEVPRDFMPMASGCRDVVVPGESSESVPAMTELTIHDYVSARASMRRSRVCTQYTSKNWENRFGNQMYVWAQAFVDNALCGAVRATDPRILNADYCRQPVVGDLTSERCRRWIRARDSGNQKCEWHAWGYGLALEELRDEFVRATYSVLRNASLDKEPPCAHVDTLPRGAPYAALYYRCGDFLNSRYSGAVTDKKMGHTFVSFPWFAKFVPAAVAGLDHIVIFGNRNVHSGAPGRVNEAYGNACTDLFERLRRFLAKTTGATVHIAPDLSGRVPLVRDMRCMSQSRVLVAGSTASSFAYWQTLLHAGCASYQPHHANTTHLFSQHRLTARQRFVTASPAELLRLPEATPDQMVNALSATGSVSPS